MLSTLKSGSYSDLELVCGTHTFNVHAVVIERKCAFFKSRSARDNAWKPRIDLSADKPAIIARLIYYLYTNSYPKTNVALTGVRDFRTISDDYILQGREDLMHVAMYAAGIKFGVSDLATTASKAFRALGQGAGHFLKDDSWIGIATFIYKSTPDTDRELRNIVIRELQYALLYDRSLIKSMDKVEVLLEKVPSLTRDLALMPLSTTKYSCDKCWQKQYLLLPPRRHDTKHGADDKECARLNRTVQECFNCHHIGMFSKAWFK